MKKKAILKKHPQKQKYLSWCDAAEVILREEGRALGYIELATKAIDRGLLHTASKTPGISMHVSLRSEMERRQERKEPQRFVFLGRGMFTLVELVTGGRAAKTRTALDQVRESRLEACKQL